MTMPEDVRAAIANGELEAGFEALLRNLNIWDAIDSAARQRAHSNAEVFFTHETPVLRTYRPDEALIRANQIPVQVAPGNETLRCSGRWPSGSPPSYPSPLNEFQA